MLRPYALVSAAAAMSRSVFASGRRYSSAMRSAASRIPYPPARLDWLDTLTAAGVLVVVARPGNYDETITTVTSGMQTK